MAVLKLSDDLVDAAKPIAAALKRSVPKQIEYWATFGKAAEENPELTVEAIKGIFIGLEQIKAGQTGDYDLGQRKSKKVA